MKIRKKNKFFIIVIMLILLAIYFNASSAKIVHVAVYGDDSTGDGSEIKPFGSVQKAIEEICNYSHPSPGDTIYVHEGIYTNEPRSGGYPIYGEYGTYVYLMGVPGEDKPVFKNGVTAGFTSMHSGDTPPHNFVLKRLIYDNAPAESGIHNINIYAWDGNQEKKSFVHNFIIDSCEFYNHVGWTNGQMIKTAGVDSFIIRNCYFKGDLDLEHFTDPMALALTGAHYGDVYNNVVDSVFQGGIQLKGGCHDIVIRNNIFRNCAMAAINFGGSMDVGKCRPDTASMPDPPAEAWDCEAYSNVIIDCPWPVQFNGSRDCNFYNNLIIQENPILENGNSFDPYCLVIIRHTTSSWNSTAPRDLLIANNVFYFNKIRDYYQNIFFQEPVSQGGDDDLYAHTIKFYNNSWYCWEDPEDSYRNWTNEGRWNMVDTLNNAFGENPGLREDPNTGIHFPTNSSLLAFQGINITPPDSYDYRDFFGEMFSNPPPIGPININSEPGSPPSHPLMNKLMPISK